MKSFVDEIPDEILINILGFVLNFNCKKNVSLNQKKDISSLSKTNKKINQLSQKIILEKNCNIVDFFRKNDKNFTKVCKVHDNLYDGEIIKLKKIINDNYKKNSEYVPSKVKIFRSIFDNNFINIHMNSKEELSNLKTKCSFLSK